MSARGALRTTLALAAAALAAAPVWGDPPALGELPKASTEPFAATTSSGPVLATTADPYAGRLIKSVRIDRANVFDPTVPGEDWWPFRMADKIHVKTREHVVERELLLGTGDKWEPLKGLESERNLRQLGFFRKAEIKPISRPDGGVDLDVRTQDSWTTNIQFSAGTEGGDNYLNYGFAEDNLLGYGKSVMYLHSERTGLVSRRSNEVRYDDTRLWGSRWRLTPDYARSNFGDSINVAAFRPFFSLDTPHAGGAQWNRTIDEDVLYANGDVYSRFIERSQLVQGGWGWRLPQDRLFVQRVEAGWYEEKDEFTPTSDTVGPLPADRSMSGPVAGYSWIQPQYIKETYIDKMERVEDFNMGNELKAYGGFLPADLGGDRDRWVFNVMDQQGLFVLPGRFVLSQVGVTGREAGGHWENAILYANLNLFWKVGVGLPQTWVAHLETNRGRNLDGENQVILGGSNGLRGYHNYAFVGGKSVLLNVEDRVFFPGEYFHLARFGAAAFFDSGAVQPENVGVRWSDFKSDVGVGLRIGSTRSESGGVLRADLAYALNQGPTGGRWVVSIRGGQAFSIFNSSTKGFRTSPTSQLGLRPPP